MLRTPSKDTSSSAGPSSAKRVFHLTSPDLQNEKRQAKRIMAGDNISVGNMAQKDLVKILGDLLEQKTEHLATRADIVKLQEEVLALKSECDALKKEVNSLNATNAVLKKKWRLARSAKRGLTLSSRVCRRRVQVIRMPKSKNFAKVDSVSKSN